MKELFFTIALIFVGYFGVVIGKYMMDETAKAQTKQIQLKKDGYKNIFGPIWIK